LLVYCGDIGCCRYSASAGCWEMTWVIVVLLISCSFSMMLMWLFVFVFVVLYYFIIYCMLYIFFVFVFCSYILVAIFDRRLVGCFWCCIFLIVVAAIYGCLCWVNIALRKFSSDTWVSLTVCVELGTGEMSFELRWRAIWCPCRLSLLAHREKTNGGARYTREFNYVRNY
jgi:hypothetical protein